jgi:M6 family metalloprotease-like protein
VKLLGLFLALTALLLPQEAAPCPAIPFPVEVAQPDGKTFTVEVKGDEYLHFVREISTGYTVIQSEDGTWWYAELGTEGRLAPSNHRVGDADPATTGLAPDLEPIAPSVRHPSLPPGADPHRPPVPAGKSGMLNLPAATEIVALMCQFSGTSGYNTQAYWNTMLFGASPSLTDYYDEVSYGQFAVTGVVHDWRALPQTLSAYNSDASLWTRMIGDAIAAFDPYVNFADYDDDGDGLVDHLLLVCAGDDPSDGSGTGLWPHMSWSGSPVATADGVDIGSYFVVDDYTFSSDHRANLGTVCHEFGHNLSWPMGFADLYDPNSGSMSLDDLNNHPMRHWCLMGDGNWSGPSTSTLGTVPAHPSGFHRMYAGWLTPTTITTNGTSALSPIEGTTGTRLYKIPVAAKPQEFFLLEFRKPIPTATYDKYSYWCSYGGNYPRLDPGLLVTRVDSTMWAKAVTNAANIGTSSYTNYSVEVVDSGFLGYTAGSTCPDTITTYNETRTSAPFSSEDGAASMSAPLSNRFDGTASGISLSSIGSGSGSTISFTLTRTGAGTESRLLLHDDAFPIGAFYSATGTLRAVKFQGPSSGANFNISRAYLCFSSSGTPATFKLHVMNGAGSAELVTPFVVALTSAQAYPLWREVDLTAYPALQGLAPGTEFRVAVEYTSTDIPYLWFDPFAGLGYSYQKAPAGPWQLSTSGGSNVDYLIRVDVTANGIVPVALTGFEARAVDGGVRLDWSVADPLNHAGFRVYRSPALGGDWQTLRRELVQGTNGRYSYLDGTVTPGESYRYRLGEISRDGVETSMGLVEVAVPRLLAPAVSLLGVEPNPSRGTARVMLQTSWSGAIRLDVFDLSGRRLRTLVDQIVPGGKLGFDWDGRDDAGRAVGSGVYLVRLRSGGKVESEKVTILR